MEKTFIIKWPVVRRFAKTHLYAPPTKHKRRCHNCNRIVYIEMAWRVLVIDEDYINPYIPTIFQREKKRDLILCTNCFPTRKSARQYMLSGKFMKLKGVPLPFKFVSPEKDYYPLGRISTSKIDANQITSARIDSSSYLMSSGCYSLMPYHQTIAYYQDYDEEARRTHRVTITEKDGFVRKFAFGSEAQLNLFLKMASKETKIKVEKDEPRRNHKVLRNRGGVSYKERKIRVSTTSTGPR